MKRLRVRRSAPSRLQIGSGDHARTCRNLATLPSDRGQEGSLDVATRWWLLKALIRQLNSAEQARVCWAVIVLSAVIFAAREPSIALATSLALEFQRHPIT